MDKVMVKRGSLCKCSKCGVFKKLYPLSKGGRKGNLVTNADQKSKQKGS
jgi:hypothetical protein